MAPMDKRTATSSYRLTPELEHQIQQIALAQDVTVSDLTFQTMQAMANAEFSRYLKLRAAFEANPDLPGFRKGDDE